MEVLQIVLMAIAALSGMLFSISVPKRKNKLRLQIGAVGLFIGIVVCQIVIVGRDSQEKQDQHQEFLRLKYSQVLDDDKILQTVHDFETSKDNVRSMSIALSPTSGTIGESIKALWIEVPCPKTLSNKYKVIDPSNYGLQNITPLYPVTSLSDNQKYYIGMIVVPVKKFSPTDKLIVVTKHTNGFLEVETVEIGTHTFDISTFHFNPIDE